MNRWTLATAFSALLIATCPRAQPESQADGDRSLGAFVDGVIEDAMQADHLAGVAVAVVRDGAIVVLRGYGVSRAKPFARVDAGSTLFRVGSISKTFTWIALMKEIERGTIRLDEPVNNYLPAELRIRDAGFRRPVRVVDLMSHAAGFADGELGFLMANDVQQLLPMAEFLRRYQPRRVREPGVLASYSNYGATLAGQIVRSVRRQSYESVIETEILQPLNMRATTVRESYAPRSDLPDPMPAALASNTAAGFDWTGAAFAEAPPEYLSQTAPAGSASMSAADAARYMLMLLNDGRLGDVSIYSAQTAQAFRTPILSAPKGVNGWAHGFATTVLPGGFQGFGHSGATSNFHSNLVIVPELRLGVFIVTNTSTGWSIARRFPRLVVEQCCAPAPAEERRPGSAALAETRELYEGAYLTTRRPYAGLEKLVELLGGTATVSVTGDGYLITRYGPLNQDWVPEGKPGHFRAATGAEELTFKLDRDGRAQSFPLASGNATLERVGVLWTRAAFDVLGTLTLVAAAAICIAFFSARRRWLNSTTWQRSAAIGATIAASLWVLAGIAFRQWLPHWESGAALFLFPGFWLTTASSAALIAAIVSALALLAVSMAWRERSADDRCFWPKAGLTIALIPFLAFACLLAAWGALRPWVLR